jgi:hypothetical protein
MEIMVACSFLKLEIIVIVWKNCVQGKALFADFCSLRYFPVSSAHVLMVMWALFIFSMFVASICGNI